MRNVRAAHYLRLRRTLSEAVLSLALLTALLGPVIGQRIDGFNVIVAPGHPFGTSSAKHALIAAQRLGATTIAIVPFLWQASPSSPDLIRGTDMATRSCVRQSGRCERWAFRSW